MNATTSDLASLYAAIAQNPDDDTVRLALADALDELDAVRVPCPQCIGTGSHALNPYELAARYGTHRAGAILDAAKCGVCAGTGTVVDAANGARAELIRVQVELAPLSRLEDDYGTCRSCDGDGLSSGPPECRPCRACASTGKADAVGYSRVKTLLARERELLASEVPK